MASKEEPTPQPLSQASVASFVFGTIQLVLLAIVIGVMKFIAQLMTSFMSAMPNAGTALGQSTGSKEVTFLEIVALLFINVLPLLGLIAGFSGMYAASSKGYGGSTLATMGTMFSLLAIVISISFAVLGDLEPLLQILK